MALNRITVREESGLRYAMVYAADKVTVDRLRGDLLDFFKV